MKSRKGFSPIVYLVVVMVLMGFVAFAYINGWIPLFSKPIKVIGGYIDDCDQDRVNNNQDSCPCDTTEKGSQSNRGCPEGYVIRGDDSGRESKTCIEKGCPKTT